MDPGSARAQSMHRTRERILDAARDLLGEDAEASIGDIAVAAGVVRRTVYGHFPTRADLVRALAARAGSDMAAVLAEVDAPEAAADAAWTAFTARIWPLTRRYRVLVTLRRGEYGDDIHRVLADVDAAVAALVLRGQQQGVFARHLPATVLGALAFSAVFTVAEASTPTEPLTVEAAIVASLLALGVAGTRVEELAQGT